MARGAGMLLAVALSACGGDGEATPIEDIPAGKKLADLSASELEGVCAWAKDVASMELPPGTRCGTIPITSTGCMEVPEACPASVQQWMACTPTLFARLGDDPCQVLDLAFSLERFSAFIETTPGCAGLGACASVMSMSSSTVNPIVDDPVPCGNVLPDPPASGDDEIPGLTGVHARAGEPCTLSCAQRQPPTWSCHHPDYDPAQPQRYCLRREGLRCGDSATCEPLRAEGEACDTLDASCALDLRCGVQGTCVPLSPLGGRCENDDWCTDPERPVAACFGGVCEARDEPCVPEP